MSSCAKAPGAAPGQPLHAARDVRDGRLLATGLDQSAAGASRWSIDGLYRVPRAPEPQLGTSLLGVGLTWRA